MTPKERILNLISGKEVDLRPVQLDFSPLMLPKVYKHFGIQCGFEEDLLSYIDNHFIYAFLNDPFGRQRHRTFAENVEYDDWGVGWDMLQEGIFMVNHPLQGKDTLRGYVFPNPDRAGLLDFVAPLVKNYGDTHLVCSYQVTGLNERASALCGYTDWLMNIMIHEDFANELLDGIMDYQIKLAKNYVKAGVTCGRYGDDYGMQNSMMISPDTFRALFKPRLKKIFDVYKDEGLPLIYHSCGDIRPIIPDFIEIGVDVLNNVQPEAMPRQELADTFGDTKLIFYGGISTQQVLKKGKREDIAAEIEDCIATLGKHGKWLISTGISITSDTTLDVVDILIEEIAKRR
ncbi:uroporphyrinogen decarboxylase [Clostridia bacterium]|nr:uroporphyrinogen decarboxylase [Clostridia bacterium]